MNKRHALSACHWYCTSHLFWQSQSSLPSATQALPAWSLIRAAELNVSTWASRRGKGRGGRRQQATWHVATYIGMAADIIIAVGLTIEKFAHRRHRLLVVPMALALSGSTLASSSRMWWASWVTCWRTASHRPRWSRRWARSPSSPTRCLRSSFGEPCVRDWVALVGVMGGTSSSSSPYPRRRRSSRSTICSEHFYYPAPTSTSSRRSADRLRDDGGGASLRAEVHRRVVLSLRAHLVRHRRRRARFRFAHHSDPRRLPAAHCVHGVLPPCTQTGLHWLPGDCSASLR